VKRIASKSAPSPTNAASAENAIDVVIAWVDGRDPKHRRKRERYLADPGADDQPEQVASKERRFSDNDEIRFCLRSIRNYAPWVPLCAGVTPADSCAVRAARVVVVAG
jgi:Stealth protein CR1, conserved region 1